MLDGGACVFLHRSLSSKLVTDYRTGEGRRRTILLSGKNKIKKRAGGNKNTTGGGALDNKLAGFSGRTRSDALQRLCARAPFPFFFLIFYLLHIFDFINKIFF
jgi:hypothetical protein